MRSPSSNYNLYNTGQRLNPIWAVEIGGSNTKFVSGNFADISSPPFGVTYHKLVKGVSIDYPELQLGESHYSPATFRVDIEDLGGVFTAFANVTRIYEASCVIKFGFAEINYADFLTMTPGGTYFFEMAVSSNFYTYTLIARDTLFNVLSREALDTETPLDVSFVLLNQINAGATGFVTLIDLHGYNANQTDFANLLDERVFLAFEVFPSGSAASEIIKFTVTDTVNLELENLERGLGFTNDATHVAGTSIGFRGGFRCDVLRVFLHMFLNTTTGANGAYDLGIDPAASPTTNWNVLPFAGLTYSEIDVEGIERLGWRIFNEFEYDPEGSIYLYPGTVLNAADFIERFIQKPYGLYFKLNNGKISFGSLDLIYFLENFSAAVTFDSSNIEEVEAIWFSNYQEAKAQQYYFYGNYNWALVGGDFFGINGTTPYTIPGLTATVTERAQIQIENHGANLSTASKQIAITYLNILRTYMLREVSLMVKVRCNYKSHIYEIGDQALLTLANIPDIANAVRGLTSAKALIVGAEIDAAQKKCSFTLRLFQTPGYLSDQLSGLYQVFKIAEGSINDKTLSVSATETATTEAADAYYDNSGTDYRGDIVMFRLRITQPGFGAGSNHEILSLKFSLLDDVPAIKVADYRRYIRFNPQSSAAFEFDVYVANDDSDYDSGGGVAVNIPHRVKVDWISTTATGSEIPTVELIGVWFIRFNL